MIVLNDPGQSYRQIPPPTTYHAAPDWPADLGRLYDEAAKSYAAGAFTAAAMLARKLLMAVCCHEGADDGKTFGFYVDHVVNTVLTFPKAKAAIDKIRTIGNEANHDIQFVNQADAKTAMGVVTYLLNTVYSLPAQ